MAALGEAHVQLPVWKKGLSISPVDDLEMIRTDAQLGVSRFAELQPVVPEDDDDTG